MVIAAENGLCRKNACLSARHVAGTQRRLEGRLEGHVRGRRPAREAGRCRRCPHIAPHPETLSGDVGAVAAHCVQQATPWAPMARAYRSVSRHARRCSSNPPQGAGWDHSAEEAFMATQGPLGFSTTRNPNLKRLGNKLRSDPTPRPDEPIFLRSRAEKPSSMADQAVPAQKADARSTERQISNTCLLPHFETR